MHTFRLRPLAAGLLLTALAALLLLPRLGTPLLWQDEAETANVALNLLEQGVPTPWDGEHLVTQQAGRDAVRLGDRLLWAWHPWPQYLLAAAGLAALDEPTASPAATATAAARLPFVLVALATVPLFFLWRLDPPPGGGSSRAPDGVAAQAVATAIYCLTPVFFLHARQCRYYALLLLGGVLVLWLYSRISVRPERSMGAGLGLALCLALVFYANPLSGIALAAGLAVHAALHGIVQGRRVAARRMLEGAWRGLRPLLLPLALFALLAAPWLALVALSEVRAGDLGLAGRLRVLGSELWRFQYSMLPAVLWPVPLLLVLARTTAGTESGRLDRREDASQADAAGAWEAGLLLVLAPVAIVLVSLQAPMATVRYLLPLWPLCAAVLAAVWRRLHRRSAALGAAFLVVLLGTNLLQALPAIPLTVTRAEAAGYDREAPLLDRLARQGRPDAPLVRWVAGLVEGTPAGAGPVSALVRFVRGLEREPRAIAAGYAWESLHFYLGVPAVGPGLQRAARHRHGLPLLDPDVIDLVVPRRGWPEPALAFRGDPAFVRVVLDVPGHAYENLPEPGEARLGPSSAGPSPIPPLELWVRRALLPENSPATGPAASTSTAVPTGPM